MPETKIKTILVDDEERALNRLQILLSYFPEVEVIAQTTDSKSCIETITNLKPDLVFLDVEMPDKTGLEVADEIHRNLVNTKIIFVTSYDHYAIKAIKNQAFDYILKPGSIDELKTAINRFRANVHTNLSQRELEIIRLVAKGETSKAIGETLHISRHTVDTHRRAILEKTECKNAAELIRFVTEYKLI